MTPLIRKMSKPPDLSSQPTIVNPRSSPWFSPPSDQIMTPSTESPSFLLALTPQNLQCSRKSSLSALSDCITIWFFPISSELSSHTIIRPTSPDCFLCRGEATPFWVQFGPLTSGGLEGIDGPSPRGDCMLVSLMMSTDDWSPSSLVRSDMAWPGSQPRLG